MALSAYLDSLFRYTPYDVSDKEARAIALNKEEWIVSKLLRKRFRRSAVHPDTRATISEKVRLTLDEEVPLYIIVGFGGYKHFWNPSHPRVDFAELFNLEFMARYLAPVVAVHEPGVILEYESEDLILTLIDNYPPSALDDYAASFRGLLREFQKRAGLPANFQIRFMRPQEEEPYRSNDYQTKLFQKIEALRAENEKEWETLSAQERQERLHRTPRSIMWRGHDDLTTLSDEEREKKLVESKILNETYYEADFEFRGDYFEGGNHIPVVLTWGLSSENVGHWLTLASTDSSTVDFWIGRGILEQHEERFVNRIVSRTQYARLGGDLTVYPALDWAAGVPELVNLEQIEVVPANILLAAVAQGRAPTRT